MNRKVLFVDDDLNILQGYQRQLRKVVEFHCAIGGEEGLNVLRSQGPFAVVVADMQMPKMDGITFLREVMRLSPDTTRMMLTGNVDQKTASDAVNEGHVFRFLNKPCEPEQMVKALEAGIEQYRLVTAEAELLGKTLTGSIHLLVEILAITDPTTLGRARTVRQYAREVGSAVGYPNAHELELAGMLMYVGYLTMPPDLVKKFHSGGELTEQEHSVLAQAPKIAARLLANIPRLETVSHLVLYSQKQYHGGGFPIDEIARDRIPLGSRILKILADLAELEANGTPRTVALRQLRNQSSWYDTGLLDQINEHFVPRVSVLIPPDLPQTRTPRKLSKEDVEALRNGSVNEQPSVEVTLEELMIGDVIVSDVNASDGSMLLSSGNTITETMLLRLQNYAAHKGISGSIYVAVSEQPQDEQKAA